MLWSPDTCECQIEIADGDPAAWTDFAFAGNRLVVKCAEHALLSDTVAMVAVHTENRLTASGLYAELVAAFPTVAAKLEDRSIAWAKFARPYLKLNAQDRATFDRLKITNFCLYLDDARVLHLVTDALTTTQKANVQAKIDSRIGVGRVVVE